MRQFTNLFIFFTLMSLSFACTQPTDYKQLYEGHVKELSDPKYYGRTDYNGGITAAADYIRNTIEEIGFEWTNLPFTYNKNTMRGKVEFSVDGKEYIFTEDFIVKEFSTGKHATMDIYHLDDEYLMDKDKFYSHLCSGEFKEKFVAFNFPLFSDKFGGEGIELYKDNLTQLSGHVGGLIFKYASNPVNFISRAVYTLPFPVIGVGPEFPLDAKQATVNLENEWIENYNGVNVASFVEGKNGGDEHFIVLAHYDHLGMIGQGNIFTGANDNASGVGALLAMMQYYKTHQPETSILFLFLDGEEANLLGAKDYVQNPYKPLKDVKFVINLDMVGDNGKNIICEVGGGEQGNAGYELFKKINGEKGYFTSVDQQPFTDNSDHYYFGINGVPCMYFTIEGDMYQYYHTPRDTYEHFSSEKFNDLFGLMLDFLKEF